MPGIDLSALSSAELKRLLAAARARGDAPLAERVEAEIAVRAATAGRVAVAMRPRGATQAMAPDWHEPAWEEPAWDEPVAAAGVADEAPLVLGRPAAPPRRPAAGRALPLAVGLLAGGLLTAGVAWGVMSWRTASPPKAPLAMAALSAPASHAPAPAVPVAVPALPPSGEPTVAASHPDAASPVTDPTPAAETTQAAPRRKPAGAHERAAATPPVRLAKARPEVERPRRVDACARPPTYADRMVCDDLGLQELDFEARAAYARAREAHADPVVLNEAQDAWRRARDETSDRKRLARLYDARIRELNAATEAARRQEPPLD